MTVDPLHAAAAAVLARSTPDDVRAAVRVLDLFGASPALAQHEAAVILSETAIALDDALNEDRA